MLDSEELENNLRDDRVNIITAFPNQPEGRILASRTKGILPQDMQTSMYLGGHPETHFSQAAISREFQKLQAEEPRRTPLFLSVTFPGYLEKQKTYNKWVAAKAIRRFANTRDKINVSIAGDKRPIGLPVTIFATYPAVLQQEELLASKGGRGETPPGVIPILIYDVSPDNLEANLGLEKVLAALQIAIKKTPNVAVGAGSKEIEDITSAPDSLVTPSQWVNRMPGLIKAAIGAYEVPIDAYRKQIETFQDKLLTALRAETTGSKFETTDATLANTRQELRAEQTWGLAQKLEELESRGLISTLLNLRKEVHNDSRYEGLLRNICGGNQVGPLVNHYLIDSAETEKIQQLANIVKDYIDGKKEQFRTLCRRKLQGQIGGCRELGFEIDQGDIMSVLIDKVSERLSERLDMRDGERFKEGNPAVLVPNPKKSGEYWGEKIAAGIVLWETPDGRIFSAFVGSQFRQFRQERG